MATDETIVIGMIDVELDVWLQFDGQMHRVGVVTGDAVTLASPQGLHDAIKEAVTGVAESVQGDLVVRVTIPKVSR
jgi:hypothetical protein